MMAALILDTNNDPAGDVADLDSALGLVSLLTTRTGPTAGPPYKILRIDVDATAGFH